MFCSAGLAPTSHVVHAGAMKADFGVLSGPTFFSALLVVAVVAECLTLGKLLRAANVCPFPYSAHAVFAEDYGLSGRIDVVEFQLLG